VPADATDSEAALLTTGFASPGAHVASLFPEAAVVEAGNTIGAEHLQGGTFGEQRLFLPIAGDDAGHLVVAQAARVPGSEVADPGGSGAEGLVGNLSPLRIWLALRRGRGRDLAFRVIRA
jgi:predicted dinucleotide-binding enzyme